LHNLNYPTQIQKGVTDAASDEYAHRTPLAIKLDEFGNTLTIAIGVICIAVWIASIPKFYDPSFTSPVEGAVYYAKVAVVSFCCSNYAKFICSLPAN